MTTATKASHVDIAADRVAKIYAQAVVDAAEAAGCRREVLVELATLARDVLPKVPEAAAVFSSPKVALEDKNRIIKRLTAGRMQATTTNALHVLARHGRLGLLGAVVDAAERLADEREGRQQATFTTAVPLDAAEQSRLVDDTQKALAAALVPTFVVDPAIIGGLVVRVGDTIYDQSVATGLAHLGGRLQDRNIRAIQNGEYTWQT
ncbi:MAG: ATP synthase F1 subunit delta [Planctomycetota bacterium]|jgi:F-type H+-transporting ATPase subunit delta|nr:MAG: ATP synthase F1 subunit delta [Planctomycetota bacterium]